jgi:hypothetical protein
VIFAEDFRKPAYSSLRFAGAALKIGTTHIELSLLNILEKDGHRALAWLSVIHIARAMRGQVGLSMLILRYLELARHDLSVEDSIYTRDCLPLIETNGVLHKQQCLLRQERRAQCGGEIELVQEHSDHLRVVCNGHCLLAFEPFTQHCDAQADHRHSKVSQKS